MGAIACLQDAVAAAKDGSRVAYQLELARCLVVRHQIEPAAQMVDAIESDDPLLTFQQLILRGRICLGRGAPDEARAAFTAARALAAGQDDATLLARSLRGMARAAAQSGEVDFQLLQQASAVARQADPRERGHTLILEGRLRLAEGELSAARRAYLRAIKVFEKQGCRLDLADAYLGFGRVLGEQSRATPDASVEPAAPWIARAQAIYRELGTTVELQRIRDAFGRYGRRRTDRMPAEQVARVLSQLDRRRSAIQREQANHQSALASRAETDPTLAALLSEHDRAIAFHLERLAELDQQLVTAVNEIAAERERSHLLFHLTERLARAGTPAEVLDQCAATEVALTNADRVVVAEMRPGGLVRIAAIRFPEADDSWRAAAEQALAAGGPILAGRGAAGRAGEDSSALLGEILAVPLQRGESSLGVIYLDKGLCGGVFDAVDLELSMVLATQAALLLENARTSEARGLEARERAVTLDTIGDAVLAIDLAGHVTSTNRVARRLLKLGSPPTSIANTPALGFLSGLLGGGDVADQVVSVSGAEFLLNLRSVVAVQGGVSSHVVTLSPLARVRRIAHNLVGQVARFSFADIVGESPAIRRCVVAAEAAARSTSTVLLTGESGTGKEVFAQAIHNASARAEGPFVGLNCAALPRELLESELFGYEAGAFTGARRTGQAGKFELAAGGTLLLDEIGEMPPEMQVKLLRVLEERNLTRVGGSRVIPLDVRLIATTNRDLRLEVERGTFRRDLFYRLRVLHIELPPLRARREDILPLAHGFLAGQSARLGRSPPNLDPDLSRALQLHSWPGNIRELEHLIEAELNLLPAGQTVLHTIPVSLRAASSTAADGAHTIQGAIRDVMVTMLRETRGDTREVARRLGVSRSTVYARLKRLGLDPGDYRRG